VGRNEEENNRLSILAKNQGIPLLETVAYKGPITLIIGKSEPTIIKNAAAITVRYSDSPKKNPVKVRIRGEKEQIIEVMAMKEETLDVLRI
jgi:hypothetical protein